MKRNFLLFLVFMVSILLIVNGVKRLLTFRTTAQRIQEAEMDLERVGKENQELKSELEYKRSKEFIEAEIRNKLGLSKEGESIIILPKDENPKSAIPNPKSEISNWHKWWKLFFW